MRKWTRKFSNGHFDQTWTVVIEAFLERSFKLNGRLDAAASDAKTVSKLHEVRIPEVARNIAPPEGLLLGSPDITERVIVEKYRHEVYPVLYCGSQFLYAEHEPAIANDTNDLPIGKGYLRAECRRKAVS